MEPVEEINVPETAELVMIVPAAAEKMIEEKSAVVEEVKAAETQHPATPDVIITSQNLPAVAEESNRLPTTRTAEEQEDDFLDDLGDSLGENISSSDIQVSRVQIGQPGVPEVAGNTPGYTGGCLIDNITREVYSVTEKAPWLLDKPGIDPATLQPMTFARFVPIFVLPHEYIKWKSQDEGGGWEFKTLDLTEPRVRDGMWPPKGRWKPQEGEKKSPPVTENINVLGYFVNAAGLPVSLPVVMTFARTSFSGGKRLLTAIAGNRKGVKVLAPWDKIYYLYSTKCQRTEGGKTNTWYEIGVAEGPKLETLDPNREMYNLCKGAAMPFMNKELMPNETIVGTNKTMTVGRKLQEMYLNAAQDAEFGDAAEGDADPNAGVDDSPKDGNPF